jgi:hypothetical protein
MIKQILRAVATVAGNTCDFNVDVQKYAPYAPRTHTSGMITAARREWKDFQKGLI